MAQSLGETEINQRKVFIYLRTGSYSLEDKLVEAAGETIQVSRGYPFSIRLVFLYPKVIYEGIKMYITYLFFFVFYLFLFFFFLLLFRL